MGFIHIFERKGEEYVEYMEALKKAKKATEMAGEAMDILCDLTEEMEDQYGDENYGERRGGSMRGSMRGGYNRAGWDEMDGAYSRRGRRMR